nr:MULTISPECIES: potassium-transporting ATPase subunit F [unclassified Frigoribacterium]
MTRCAHDGHRAVRPVDRPPWSRSARHRVRARRHRCVRSGVPRGEGGREAVIVFSIGAAVLAVAALAYLVYALVKPERF